MMLASLCALLTVGVSTTARAQLEILVYDNNTQNHYAQTAANNLSTSVTVADVSTFNGLLTSQTWDLVLVDAPSDYPDWGDLVTYTSGGNCVVMSFWLWNDEPSLQAPFGFTGTTSFGLVDGQSIIDAAPTAAGTAVFAGVPGVPHSSWYDHWGDDGDVFTFTGGNAIANLSTAAALLGPAIIENATGNAIAAFLIDEWNGPGAVELWEGMANRCLSSVPSTSRTGLILLAMGLLAIGVLALRRLS